MIINDASRGTWCVVTSTTIRTFTDVREADACAIRIGGERLDRAEFIEYLRACRATPPAWLPRIPSDVFWGDEDEWIADQFFGPTVP